MEHTTLKYQRIRDLREDRDLSQKDLANYLNISQNTYSQYETNTLNISIDTMMRLADYYNTSVDYLIGRTDDPSPPKRL